MPSLKELSVRPETTGQEPDVATQLPSFDKRRIWIAPLVSSHSAIILTATKLYLVPGLTPPPADHVSAVMNGAEPGSRFGQMMTVVTLGAVRSVTHDLLENRVHIDSRAGSGSTGEWTSRVTISFTEAEPADALFAKLWRRLGDEFKLRPDRPPNSKAVQLPFVALFGILISTAVLGFAANSAADLGRATPSLLSPLRSIDWRWIAVFGGIAAAIVQVWLYRRLTRPPVRLELIKA